jgi:hypothetical protein
MNRAPRRLLLAAGLAAACGPVAKQDTPAPEPPRGWAERVAGRDACLNVFKCPAFAPFHRPSDTLLGKVLWLVSESGHACIVSDDDYTMVPDHESFTCVWRSPRGPRDAVRRGGG